MISRLTPPDGNHEYAKTGSGPYSNERIKKKEIVLTAIDSERYLSHRVFCIPAYFRVL